jgi:osmoprotectant transport system permease protein
MNQQLSALGQQLADLLEKLPAYLGGHMLVSAAALFIGLLISVPLGIAISRRSKWLAETVLGAAGVIQTVPSLALLALMVYVLGGLIGFWPAFIALTLYSLLPILVNTVIGIRGVSPLYVEAARGLGMSERQMLFRVQLPLAAPVIIGGIRTATVLVVGTATLVTPVGGESLGNYIFGGLESMNPLSTVFGCVIAALLAVLMDQLVRQVEVASRDRSRRRAWVGVVGLLLVFGAGLAPPVARLFDRRPVAVVASGPFTEQHILGDVLALQLEARGFRADRRQGMSEGIQIEALRHNQVDCMVNYSGNIWTLVMKEKDFPDATSKEEMRATMNERIADFLRERYGIVSLGSLGFEDAYVFAMTRGRAEELRLPRYSLEELGKLSRERRLTVGADNQFFTRPEWDRVKTKYGFGEVTETAMEPSLMYGAAKSGKVDVIVAYSSDGRLTDPDFDLRTLADPDNALPPYDALLLLSPGADRRPGLRQALAPLKDSISEKAMQEENKSVDVGKVPARLAAKDLYEKLRTR